MKRRNLLLRTTRILAIPAGILGLWMAFRAPLLEHLILSKLEENHIDATIGKLRWTGLLSAELENFRLNSGSSKLKVEQLDLGFSPAFSFSGQDWLESYDLKSGSLHSQGLQFDFDAKGNWENQEGALIGKLRGKGIQMSVDAGWLRDAQNKDLPMMLQIKDISLDHPRLAAERRVLPNAQAALRIGKSAQGCWELKQGSKATMAGFESSWKGKFDRRKGEFELFCGIPQQAAQSGLGILASISPSLEGLVVAGEVEGAYGLRCNVHELNSLQIFADLKGHSLKILDPGKSKINDLQSKLLASGGHKDSLPPLLKSVVVLAEDGNFWTHRGFDLEAMRLAMLENLEESRFARGGGTIPMQLVRNHCLDQGKRLERKLAELSLTFLLEECYQHTKTQELALYLNQIEWGPKVFGIRQASDYYFGKRPAQLNQDEILFLAMIIPNPRHWQKLIGADGQPDDFAQETAASLKWMLYENGEIEEVDLEQDLQLQFRPGLLPQSAQSAQEPESARLSREKALSL